MFHLPNGGYSQKRVVFVCNGIKNNIDIDAYFFCLVGSSKNFIFNQTQFTYTVKPIIKPKQG